MNVRALIPWMLAGGLVASTLCNVSLAYRLEKVEARLDQSPRLIREPAALPGRIVTRLALTREQCAVIEGCSMT